MSTRFFQVVLLICYCQLSLSDQVNIVWSGIEGDLLDNAKKYVKLAQEDTIAADRIRYLFDVADDGILWSLEPFGYYHAGVKTRLTPPQKGSDVWTAYFEVSLNQPVIVDEINLTLSGEADKDKDFIEFLNHYPISRGDILNQPLYDKSKNELINLARTNGYFDAKLVNHELQIYKKDNKAVIILHLNSKERYCLNDVHFEQQQFTDELLYRYIPFKKGEFYHREHISEFRQQLLNSNYFSQINIDEKKVNFNNRPCVDLLVRPLLKKRYTMRGRLGYGTDTSFRAGLDGGVSFLNEKGHYLKAGLGYTVNRNRHLFKADYTIPDPGNKDQFWNIGLSYKGEDFTSADVKQEQLDGLTRVEDLSLSLALHKPRDLWGGLKLDQIFSLEFLTESYEMFPLLFSRDEQDLLGTILLNPEFEKDFFSGVGIELINPNHQLLSFAVNWTFDYFDNSLYANRGFLTQLKLSGASKRLGSDVDYWQLYSRSKIIQRLNDKSRLILKSEFAYTDAEVIYFGEIPIIQLPKALLFAAGGSNSIRGYPFEELKDDKYLPMAKHLLLASLEYEYEIFPQWSLAAFYDVGNAFSDFAEFDAKSGLGFGIHWHSPVGMIRLDIAYAPERDDSPVRLHFTLGPDF